MIDITESFFRYWGKAGTEDEDRFHLLVYHCLDVVAVAKCWLRASPLLRARFAAMTGLEVEQAIAWLLFFIAIHDLGKFDIRFQVNTPPAKAGGFGLRLKAGSVGTSADGCRYTT